MPCLKIAADKLDKLRPSDQVVEVNPVVTKVDVTRDLIGSFYAKGDWKSKHQELAIALEKQFGIRFKDNGNSFDSCLQFESQDPYGDFKVRVKYYWKNLQLLQSESVQKSLGMNTKAIFYPSVRMGRVLLEGANHGISRIEISYTVSSCDAESQFFDPFFGKLSE